MSIEVDAMKNSSQVLAGRLRFLRDASAAVGLASVILGSMVLVGVGMLGDTVWLSRQQNMLEDAVDAAGVAAFKELGNLNPSDTAEDQKKQLTKIIKRYVLVNVPALYRDSVEKTLKVGFRKRKTTSNGNEKETVDLQVKAKRGGASPFIGVGKDDVIQARISVERAIVPVDVVLAFDTSAGNSNKRLEGIQAAARTLINALYVAGGKHVSMGVVPYSAATVNIGTQRTGWIKPNDIGMGHKKAPPDSKYAQPLYQPGGVFGDRFSARWGGCVEHRVKPGGMDRFDLSLATHDVEKFASYYYPYDPDEIASPWAAGQGPQMGCPGNVIVQLTSDRSSIEQEVDALHLNGVGGLGYPAGGGMIHLGVVWGRRVLAPSWRTAWGLPQSTAGERRKVLVLLSSAVRDTMWKGAYSAYGRPGPGPEEKGHLDGDPLDGVVTQSAVLNKLDGITKENCSLGRKEGTTIFAVLAMARRHRATREAAVKVLKECTGSPGNVFEADDKAEIVDVFTRVGKRIGTMRRVKPPPGDI